MQGLLSNQLEDVLRSTVLAAVESTGVVNIPLLAEQICQIHAMEEVEDIERALLDLAQWANAPIEFDGSREG